MAINGRTGNGHYLGTWRLPGARLEADWLHKEALFILNNLAIKTTGKPYNEQTDENKAALKITLQREMRQNTTILKAKPSPFRPIGRSHCF